MVCKPASWVSGMSASGELAGVVVVDEVLEDGLLVEVDVVVLEKKSNYGNQLILSLDVLLT